MFAPTLPSDLLVNVYINLNKLCLTVYQLHALQPTSTKVQPRPVPLARPPQPCPASPVPFGPPHQATASAQNFRPAGGALLHSPGAML
jgi:hypothetical protein